MKNNAVTDQEKREKKIVVKKLAEMEEELKLLALSENLTDQVGFCMQKVFNECKSINYKLIRIPDKSKCKKDQKDFCPKRGLGYLP